MTASYLQEIFSRPDILNRARDCSNETTKSSFFISESEKGLISLGRIIEEDEKSFKKISSKKYFINHPQHFTHWSEYVQSRLISYIGKVDVEELKSAKRVILTGWTLDELSKESSLKLEIALSSRDRMVDPRTTLNQGVSTADYLMLNRLKDIINPNIILVKGNRQYYDSPNVDFLAVNQIVEPVFGLKLETNIMSDLLRVLRPDHNLTNHSKKAYEKLAGVLNLNNGQLDLREV